ncbi:peptidase inhibitor family I36 protein [Streptomyces sp. NPDC020412]|uniref:peptidase inhibitor family I36 protein n=1 Tax=Streptomyces sp. NPDC020412 TaxID=3365073 RepID=UPI00379CD9A2
MTQLIYGRGVEACPAGSFCLYRDAFYNKLSDHNDDKILVINDGDGVDDFSAYSFDHSDDGVSSVVNNTGKTNVLFSRPVQQGYTLPVEVNARINDLTSVPYPDGGSWNDRAQSALAAPSPPKTLAVTLDEPANGAKVHANVTLAGTCTPDTDTIEVYLDGTLRELLPHPASADGNWTYEGFQHTPIDGANQSHTLKVTAKRGTESVDSAQITVEVTAANLSITQSLKAHWADQKPREVYSYALVLKAAESNVHDWKVMFALPDNAQLHEAFTKSFWGQILSDGSDGTVILASPKGGQHVVPKEGSLEIDVQIVMPEQSDTYKTLKSLRAYQID